MHSTLRIGAAIAAVAVAAALPVGSGRAQDDGFVPLFDGKSLTGFKPVGVKDDTFKVVDGEIVCTGKPNGYLATEKSYRNYTLRWEWKYTQKAGNSGCLVHITGEHKVWPKCVEVQGLLKDQGNIFAINGFKGKYKKDPEAQKKAIKGVGEWNAMEVISKDGALTAFINGIKVCEGEGDAKEGAVGWQSEGAPINFRNLRIKVAD